MGTLSVWRIAKRFTGIGQESLPNLEALLEKAFSEPADEYRVAARVTPIVLGGLGLLGLIAIFVFHAWSLLAIPIAFLILAPVSWFSFDWADRRIPRSTVRMRKHGKKLYMEYMRFMSLLGVDPVLSPETGRLLEEAATIYAKHSALTNRSGSSDRAISALEDGLASLFEWAVTSPAAAQKAEGASSPAATILAEMRLLDRALDQHHGVGASLMEGEASPLAALREARAELGRIDSAIEELDQNRLSP